ncbi:hypothetical protein [Streptomyces sodiiphilus]
MNARRRRPLFFALMAVCLTLFISSWAFVRLWSVPVAVAMAVLAMLTLMAARFTANARDNEESWWNRRP